MNIYCDLCSHEMKLFSEDADTRIVDDLRDEISIYHCERGPCKRVATVIATVHTRQNYRKIRSRIEYLTPVNKEEVLNAMDIVINYVGNNDRLGETLWETLCSIRDTLITTKEETNE